LEAPSRFTFHDGAKLLTDFRPAVLAYPCSQSSAVGYVLRRPGRCAYSTPLLLLTQGSDLYLQTLSGMSRSFYPVALGLKGAYGRIFVSRCV